MGSLPLVVARCEPAHLLSPPHDSNPGPFGPTRSLMQLHAACTLVSPHTHSLSLSPLLSLHAHRYRHALVVSTRVGHIKYRASPGEAACTCVPKHGTHGAAQHTRALSSDTSPTVRPTRLRPSSPPTVLARLCSPLLASALDASSSHGALLTSLLPLLLLLLLCCCCYCCCCLSVPLSGVSGVGEG